MRTELPIGTIVFKTYDSGRHCYVSAGTVRKLPDWNGMGNAVQWDDGYEIKPPFQWFLSLSEAEEYARIENTKHMWRKQETIKQAKEHEEYLIQLTQERDTLLQQAWNRTHGDPDECDTVEHACYGSEITPSIKQVKALRQYVQSRS